MRGRKDCVKMRPKTVHLPQVYIDALQELVRRKLYPNVSEAISEAIRDLTVSDLMTERGYERG